MLHKGRNPGVVEIARINKDSRDENLPGRLAAAIETACENRHDASALVGAAWMIFAELIDNVFSHSSTPIDGLAALQVYKKETSSRSPSPIAGSAFSKPFAQS